MVLLLIHKKYNTCEVFSIWRKVAGFTGPFLNNYYPINSHSRDFVLF
ncbi:hypothetical protein CLV48_101101 [Cecembia rubra]|uniref:Uncharacterized protein n=1 Tax=Cecembia rubra TaxID=1485585 RepID=A0A2P8ECG3_9BACT|nr:hypothetical protein CLV48_101101 [Cecembia rubra]